MNDIVVDVQQVNKSFGNEQVLKNVSLQLEKGKYTVSSDATAAEKRC